MAKWCDQGESNVLNIYLKNAAQNTNLYLGLYKNSAEPSEAAALSDLTEPSGAGYSRQTLAPGDWAISGSVPTMATGSQEVFNCSGGDWAYVYGYFIATVSAGTVGSLIAVEQFSNGPYNVLDGGSVKVTPRITAD